MAQLTNHPDIRPILEQDLPWAAYALADLEPGYFEHAKWFASADSSALALVFIAFATPVLITVGPPAKVQEILVEIDGQLHLREMYAVVRPQVLPVLAERFQLSNQKSMLRMLLNPKRFQ